MVGMNIENMAWEGSGIVLTLPLSKADQEGEGIVKAIPYGGPNACCPATALRRWLTTAKITSGPVCRRVSHWEVIGDQALEPAAASTLS